jgi:hypothetical protein
MSCSNTTNQERKRSRSGHLLRPLSSVLVIAVAATALAPRASAQFKNLSGTLPGTVPKGAVIGAGVGVGAAVGFLIYWKLHHRGQPKLSLDHSASRFTDVTPGQPANKTIAIRNDTSVPVQINSITIEDHSGAFMLPNLPKFPLALAPKEPFNVPLAISPKDPAGSAVIHVSASNAKSRRDEAFKVSYGSPKPEKGKLLGVIPR